MANTEAKGLSRILNATHYSYRGFLAAWRNEEAFRQEVGLLIVLTPLAFFVGRSASEYALLIGTLLIVLITELLNSAIEAITDRVGIERHELSGRAKDLGSAAVFASLLLAALVWGCVIYARWGLSL
ncbi:MAG: diacylglycerol kinase [Pseudomonadota bacterium]